MTLHTLSGTEQLANISGPQFLIFKNWGLNYHDLESLFIPPPPIFPLELRVLDINIINVMQFFLLSVAVLPPLPGWSKDLFFFFQRF